MTVGPLTHKRADRRRRTRASVTTPPKEWRVKYDGICAKCGTPLLRGTVAVWDRPSKSIRCVECPTGDVPEADPVPIDAGVGGHSARVRHERLIAKREAELKERWGERVGGWITRLTDEPQSIRAWGKGADGEEHLASVLAALDGVEVLHDRRVPGKSWNIDHVVIGPAGIFVVDAKNYRGTVRIRRRGSFFNPDDRLYVGRRDCTKDADGLNWQIEVVDAALRSAGVQPLPLVTGVLCFIGGEWPLIRPSNAYRDVRLESPRSLRTLLTRDAVLDRDTIQRLARSLASALPSK
jgi:hypothetical protein